VWPSPKNVLCYKFGNQSGPGFSRELPDVLSAMPRRNDRDLVKLLERHPGKGESSPIRIAYPFLPYDL
jgi:hypothetical protein